MRVILGVTAALLTAAVLAPGSAHAALDCVRESDIQEMPVINDHTIVMKLRGRDRYKRMDLSTPCSGILYEGFVHTEHGGEFCNVGPLHVLDGQVCTIKAIVDITPAEAKDLLHHAQK